MLVVHFVCSNPHLEGVWRAFLFSSNARPMRSQSSHVKVRCRSFVCVQIYCYFWYSFTLSAKCMPLKFVGNSLYLAAHRPFALLCLIRLKGRQSITYSYCTATARYSCQDSPASKRSSAPRLFVPLLIRNRALISFSYWGAPHNR
jgi:hypothetical protein